MVQPDSKWALRFVIRAASAYRRGDNTLARVTESAQNAFQHDVTVATLNAALVDFRLRWNVKIRAIVET